MKRAFCPCCRLWIATLATAVVLVSCATADDFEVDVPADTVPSASGEQSDDDIDGDVSEDCDGGSCDGASPPAPPPPPPTVNAPPPSALDSDGDGAPDGADECPNDSEKFQAGVCGCGVPEDETDTDADGVADCDDGCPQDSDKSEPGECGCGQPDVDSDADGTSDCMEECDNDPLKLVPGECGCGRADVDRDGDGASDCGSAEDALVSAGFSHSCAVGSDARAYCWGIGTFGRLGQGAATSSNSPVAVQGLTDVLQVSSRGFSNAAFSCGVLATGAVHCWGYGAAGNMGNGTQTAVNLTPVFVTGIATAQQVTVGTGHACALLDAGEINCWGVGTLGRLGDGAAAQATEPVVVQGVTDALQVSAGDLHTCAVRASGEVACWGARSLGRLGDGGVASGSESAPVAVAAIQDAIQVSAGYQHTCAVRASGEVACWGLRENGRLGDGDATGGAALEPVTVTGITDAVQVSAGGQHSCAVRGNGQVMCWGLPIAGRLGDDQAAGASQPSPVVVTGITDAVQVVVGYEHSCAALASGGVRCWGAGGGGRLGDGNATNATVPVPVNGLP